MSGTLPVEDWLGVIRDEYLQGFVKDGGSSIKFVVPAGIDLHLAGVLKAALTELAVGLDYAVVGVDAGETRVHMPQEIFFKVAGQIDWKLLARRVILRLATESGYRIEGVKPDLGSPILGAIATSSAVDEQIINMQLQRRLPQAVTRNSNMSKDFRVAMTQLCLVELSGTGEDNETSPLIEWLTGSNRRISNVKNYLIYNSITRTNARHFFESLLHWVKYAGRAGTLILIDNSRVTLPRNPRDGLHYYTRPSVMDHYELLREFIDGTDRMNSSLMVVLTDPDFLNEEGRGYGIYQALRGRIADEVRDRTLANPMSSLVRLA